MKRTLITALVLLGTVVSGFGAYAQELAYVGAQLGGGTVAALAGGVAGTLIGGLTGVLLGLPIEIARHPQFYRIQIYRSFEEIPELDEPLPVRWGFAGAKVGFGLGVGVGAALGVIWVSQLFGVEGNPQGAWTGAFAGALAGVLLMMDSTTGRYLSSISQWHCKRIEQKTGTTIECVGGSLSPTELLLSPMVLAALGATIGYNSRVSFAVSVPMVSASF